jgi:DNA-binding transcriptional regulator of glucitol operon
MRRLWTPKWLLVHACALILIVGMLWLGLWQMHRAASGNLLSYGYAVEWPAFAAFVVFVWVKEARAAVRQTEPAPEPEATPPPRPARTGPAYDDSADEELAAYNRYLAWLNANPHANASEFPG